MKPHVKAWTCSTFIFVFILIMGISGRAQINNTIYFMQGVPQANRINPAFQPECGFYLGFPLLSPARTELSSSSLAYKDVIYPDPSEDSLITFLHPLGDKKAFLNQLKPTNVVASDLGTSLASAGFRTEVGFFTLDVTSRMDGNLYYPGDLARLILNGAVEGVTYQLDGIGLDLSVFDEISAGWSYGLLDNLNIGVRAKVLFGIGNLSTRSSDLSVTTSEETWNIRSDMLFNASLPFAHVVYTEDGMIDEIIINNDLQNPSFSTFPRYMFNGKNLGFGLDLGVDYRPMEHLQLSLSVMDLGYIRWKDEVHEVSYAMEYDYPGLELNPFDLTDEYTFEDYLDSTLTQMADSLSGFLEMTPGVVYSKMLNTKLYIGASYHVIPGISFGLLSRTDFLNGMVTEQVTASANFSAGRFINFTLSYSYINSYFKNIGAGISFNAGPMNLYLISDNALNSLFWPQETRMANLWFGMNLVFGYKQFKGIDRDRPLIY
jgi:hypothetical protein